ncbi:TPA: type II secretion system F family protein [Candidatus Micrarchaeota archaeon]|nr:MAG: hypothetical protein AUJ65_05460 [Candidatus Micrarchaeota archaeon CG1_02_51_15]HII38478.1 type II secretion system F family protein [Candidatus Micrarchaeota archaeon]
MTAPRLTKAYQQIAGLFPQRVHNYIGRLLTQGGFEILPRVFLGFAVFIAACAALFAFFVTPFLTNDINLQVLAIIIASGGIAGLMWLLLIMSADRRANNIEDVLPDALKIISANIRAGMTLENAFWGAARPEFGVFKDEIKKVSAETFGGRPISESLTRMSQRVNSAVVERAVKLMNEGIRLGGEMATLLDEVAADIISTKLLRREIATSTMTYSIFIVFASVFAAPALFALSTYYSEMNENLLQKQKTGSASSQYVQQAGLSGMGGIIGMSAAKPSEDAITSADIYWFAIAALTVTNFFSGLTLGLIREGKALRGIRYAPAFTLVSIIIFIGVYSILQTALKSVIR